MFTTKLLSINSKHILNQNLSSVIKMDIGGMRHDYNAKNNLFLEENIDVKDPIVLFEKWFTLVKNDPKTVEPNAMCLATSDREGQPSARFVLLKGFGQDGFKFFTHYTSRKGSEIAHNPKVALTFYWEHFSRSVRIEGLAEKLPFSLADDYFSKRPYQSQIGAAVSDQSNPIESREYLSKAEKELRSKYKEGEVPRPPQWGGYIVKPHVIEFWQGQTDRIHDRIRFKLSDTSGESKFIHQGVNGWVYERLAP
ncbi:unnamed protein product [Brassicogethes aeneus]|uniref:pyridoxal 5'-phosphate synthase n=1 Tax=Brassicogethes aeneus TaxID=1431903 RepID=A0A9P0B4F2_BRAAE|nr:unnamed protein product [Brassicogethes aeneus]